MANVKVFRRTHRLTDGQFNCYMPPYQGHYKPACLTMPGISSIPGRPVFPSDPAQRRTSLSSIEV
ncbi:hypothetical protein DPMN_129327 [Dreissena polymorpha]|uniref:Uncharacterized protein n=1 Tax=Dreissena polymorpha TaxID=45954 RepID=A0A9D4JWJ3_DREPO|nr:hypothetical protein DPMN_129327 [Dreissena polymorpha]